MDKNLSNPYQPRPRVVVVDGLGRRGSVTLIRVLGEHGYQCRHILRDALAPLRTNVIIDLSWCSFLDSSIIAMLLAKNTRLAASGRTLDLIIPGHHTTMSRNAARLGIEQILPVHARLPPFP